MKRHLFISMACTAALLSCTDNDMVQMDMEKPATLAAYDYMKAYGALKDYAGFNIGTDIDRNTLAAGGMEYRLAVENFSNIVPAMTFTHGEMMKANGELKTTVADDIVRRTGAKGISVTGGPLIWSNRQNSTYLNALLGPNVVRPDGDDGGYCIKVTNTISGSTTDAQVAYTFGKTPSVDASGVAEYCLSFWVRGTAEGTIECATYSDGKGSKFSPKVNVTKNWTHVEVKSHTNGINGLKSVLFNIGSFVGTLFIDNIEFSEIDYFTGELIDNLNTVNPNLDDPEATAEAVSVLTDKNEGIEDCGVSLLGEGYDPLAEYIDKTDDEKTAIIRGEMVKFIDGTIGKYKNSIREWDVLKEPLDETDPTQLRSGLDKTLGGGEFYWQDYLGRNYGAEAFKEAARQAADGSRLFIIETNLAGNDAKCDALTGYIAEMEGQGARIDGIGVEISTSTATADIAAIGSMFKKLAATGKLVKISSLTVDADNLPEDKDGNTADNGNGDEDGEVDTEAAFEAAMKEQGETYRKIVRSYMDNVPEAQRAGIVQKNLLDSTLPLGLWDKSYSRKHAYGGFVKGLTGE